MPARSARCASSHVYARVYTHSHACEHTCVSLTTDTSHTRSQASDTHAHTPCTLTRTGRCASSLQLKQKVAPHTVQLMSKASSAVRSTQHSTAHSHPRPTHLHTCAGAHLGVKRAVYRAKCACLHALFKRQPRLPCRAVSVCLGAAALMDSGKESQAQQARISDARAPACTHHTSLRLSSTKERTQKVWYLASASGGAVRLMMEVGTCEAQRKEGMTCADVQVQVLDKGA